MNKNMKDITNQPRVEVQDNDKCVVVHFSGFRQ